MGLASKSLGTFVSKVAVFFFRAAIGILTARFLGPEGKGFLYLLITSVMMCAMLGNLGLGPASIYFIGRDRNRLPAVVGNLLAITTGVGICVGTLGWVFLQYGRPDIYAEVPFWIWGIAALLVPLHLLRSQLMQVLSAVLRIKEVNIIEVVVILIHLPLLVLLVVILDKGIGGAFLAYACSEVLAATGFFVMVLHYHGRPKKPDLRLLSASLRFGIKSYLSNLMRHLSLRLNVFLLAVLAVEGVRATGVYSVATSVAELLLFVPHSIRLSLFPMIAASNTNTGEANRLTSQACRHTMLLTTSCGATIGSLAAFVIPFLYGDGFAGAVLPMLILVPGVVMLSQAHIFYGDLTGRGKPGATAISASASLIVTVVLDLLLIPRYGITGAAIAATCAYSIEFVVAGSFFIFYSGLAWRDVLVFRRSDLRHYAWNFRNKATKVTTTA